MIRETPNNEANVLRFTFAAFFIGTSAFSGIALWALYANFAWFGLTAGALFATPALIWRIIAHDERSHVYIETLAKEPKQAPAPQQHISNPPEKGRFTHIKNRHGEQWIYQPKAGELANFIAAALDESDRKPLGKAQAKTRGWSEKEYNALIAQLRSLEWLTDGTFNNAPVFNEDELVNVKRWLGYRERL